MLSCISQLPSFACQRFGHYWLIRLLDQCGFADIYLAQHVYIKTYVVLKVLRTYLEQKDRQKLLKEARFVTSLDHPRIVRIADFGMQDGIPYIVMQFADNGSLRSLQPQVTMLSLPIILDYVQQIADALEYPHLRDLVHQDIKPENMLIDENNRVLLSDFGLAVVVHDAMSQKTRDFACTLDYAAPERFHSKCSPPPLSDQYALGIVVYEWLTARCPFQGSSQQLTQQHLYNLSTPLRSLVSDIPPQVERVVLKSLEKKPALRFESVQAFVSALSEACKLDFIQIVLYRQAYNEATVKLSENFYDFVLKKRPRKNSVWPEKLADSLMFAFKLLDKV
jgi:eukaryotic-like serine/threonine-protein kinase